MALIILRHRFTSAARRAVIGAGPAIQQERLKQFDELCVELGFKLVDGGRSTTGEIVQILHGPAEKIVLLQRVMDQTGGYDEMNAEIIDPWTTITETGEEVSRLSLRFTPPDQDEIDRMLLDE